MKSNRIIIALSILSVALSGCVSVKTQHKIDPIHISVDINLKTDRELDDIFGDLYSTDETEVDGETVQVVE